MLQAQGQAVGGRRAIDGAAQAIHQAGDVRIRERAPGKAQRGHAQPRVQPVGIDKQHAVGPRRAGVGIAGMPGAGLDQHHAARLHRLRAVGMVEHGAARVHDADRVLGMHVQPKAVWRARAVAQLGPGGGRMAVEAVGRG